MRTINDIAQLSMFGVSPDGMRFQSERWGCLVFHASGGSRWSDTCRHCLLWVRKDMQAEDDECLSAPCSGGERRDGLDGYFSIQKMPEERWKE